MNTFIKNSSTLEMLHFRRAFVCALVGAVLGVLSVLAGASVDIGKNAPDFTLIDEQGKARKLSEFKGRTVVLEWTNHECPFVRKHYESGNMQALQEKYTKEGVVWLSIISSAEGKQGFVSADQAKTLTKQRNAHPSHVLFDASGDVGRLYGAKTTPHMYVITPEGKLVYNGAIDSIPSAKQADLKQATNYVDLAMADLKSGKDPQTAQTKPYGCSVKY